MRTAEIKINEEINRVQLEYKNSFFVLKINNPYNKKDIHFDRDEFESMMIIMRNAENYLKLIDKIRE